MSRMIKISGQGLQRRYSNGVGEGDTISDAQRKQQKKDHEALRAHSKSKRVEREARMEVRVERNISPEVEMERLKKDPTKDIDVKKIVKTAKSKTNVLAREYGLKEPNNPEALSHDRLHCYTCDRSLDSPNAYKQNEDMKDLFDDEEVRILCCWCFGKMDEAQIKFTMRKNEEATKEIRLAIYDPIESTKSEIEEMTKLKRIALKSKIKRWNAITRLVGNVKHDNVEDADWMERCVEYNAHTRYTACAGGL